MTNKTRRHRGDAYLKSDIQPVLSLGGYGIHIPFEVIWKHEVVDTFTHDHLKQVKRFDELLLLF